MQTYKVQRNYEDANRSKATVRTGLTLEQAQAHCKSPETCSRTCKGAEGLEHTRTHGGWFDGWTEEK